MGLDQCTIYDCCTNDKKFPHRGKCLELMCEWFNRIRDTPGITEAEALASLAAMEKELRRRK